MNQIRHLVSQQKKRFLDDGFDLDLTYITPRIIAMGFPSEGTEAVYRNRMIDVKEFFTKRHDKKHKIYNLCIEREYHLYDHFYCAARYPFDDHNICTLQKMGEFCNDCDDFLKRDPENVIAIHCKAGKGRTGLMVAAYLLYSGFSPTAMEALEYFAKMRTNDMQGVTIPSQIRYCNYYERLLNNDCIVEKSFKIKHIRLINSVMDSRNNSILTAPELLVIPDLLGNNSVASNPSTQIILFSPADPKKFNYNHELKLFDMSEDQKQMKPQSQKSIIDLNITEDVLIKGDVKVRIMLSPKSKEEIGHIWFNTAFVNDQVLIFEKNMIDNACKDTKDLYTPSSFKVEIYLEKLDFDIDYTDDAFRKLEEVIYAKNDDEYESDEYEII